jgi:peptide/nickel transport system permease protein
MIIMRTTDVLFSIPSLIMAIILVGIFGRSMLGITLALAVGYIPMTIRVVFSTTLSERGSGYVEASKAMGASAIRILPKDIFPNILPTIIVQMTCAISWAILSESSLGFIGLGVNPPTPTWGLMLSKARETVYTAPWLAIFPGLAIMVAVFAFNILGDGLRDLFDPRAWNSGD